MWHCYNCDRALPNRAIAGYVITEHGQEVRVGSDCAKKIRDAGEEGVFSEVNGEVLYTKDAFLEVHDDTEAEDIISAKSLKEINKGAHA